MTGIVTQERLAGARRKTGEAISAAMDAGEILNALYEAERQDAEDGAELARAVDDLAEALDALRAALDPWAADAN